MLTRAMKELRLLLPPAMLMLVGAAMSWLAANDRRWFGSGIAVQVGIVAVFIGTPLLAATSFGAEFQQRTMPLILAQPIGRTRLWAEKLAVLVLAVAVLAPIQFALVPFGQAGIPLTGTVLFVVSILCSTGFWTLVARSTVGGLAFSLASLMVLEIGGAFAVAWLSGSVTPAGILVDRPALNVARILYSAIMLALGWWWFSRFQVTGTGHGDLSGSGATLPLPDTLRCRRTGVLANLLRIELRLHRPTFSVAALFAACWLLALALFALRPARIDLAEVVFTVLLTVYVPLAIVLAGTISVGEASSLGLHEWHLTLPIRSRTLWIVKLGVALVVAAALVVVLPAALALLTSATLPVQRGVLRIVPRTSTAVLIGGVVILSFWAATLFGHTVRAAVATGIALVVLRVSLSIAFWAGAQSGLGEALLASVMVRLRLPPSAFLPRADSMFLTLAAVLAPLVLVCLGQSQQAYRRVNLGSRTIALYAIGLLATVVVTGFSMTTYVNAAGSLFASEPVRELQSAIAAVSPAAATAPVERRVTVDELAGTRRLSPETTQWLSGTEIVLRGPMRAPVRRLADGRVIQRTFFRASLTFPSGMHHTIAYFVDR